ncbi:unnamed protein product [Linum tenue]|uniref:F-box domain-containing protein n=1 Tax=Linum tenue TaxID=586396 RepID=A0AAV0IAE4_9ROSI|nr:unnamed protein product [Linum tenue]
MAPADGSLKVYKRRIKRRKDVDEGMDRLSDLPDGIQHHILSFLDTVSMVQTSILSRRWRCVWKDVPALHFKRKRHYSKLDFSEHVSKLLSLRSGHAILEKVTFDYFWCPVQNGEPDMEVFDRVMQYAGSNGTGGHLHHLTFERLGNPYSSFEAMAASITKYRHHESLRYLRLYGSDLESPMTSGFKLLTTLRLHRCTLWYIDPFADFPCLNYLKLRDCSSLVNLVVSGPQLVDLEMESTRCNGTTKTVEVFAPKLKSFDYSWTKMHFKDFPKLNLPVLDHANICLHWYSILHFNDGDILTEKANRACIDLLRGLHNVKSLNVGFEVYDDEEDGMQQNFPLTEMVSLMEPEASPFTRLKTLKVHYRKGSSAPSIPYQVIVGASDRCLDPTLLEPPILDKLIHAKTAETKEQNSSVASPTSQ